MKIVIAPDSWKESLSALEVASAIEQGFREIYPDAEYVKLPVADGGEGTVEAMVAATGGLLVPLTVTGPLGEPVEAFYGLSGDRQCAFIEMAAASGLESVPPAQRNPLLTTSWGTGELIRHALDAGVRQIIIGIGGSATNDGGAGMAQALGAKLLTAEGQQIASGGGALETLARIDLSELDSRLADCRIDVACDVTRAVAHLVVPLQVFLLAGRCRARRVVHDVTSSWVSMWSGVVSRRWSSMPSSWPSTR